MEEILWHCPLPKKVRPSDCKSCYFFEKRAGNTCEIWEEIRDRLLKEEGQNE